MQPELKPKEPELNVREETKEEVTEPPFSFEYTDDTPTIPTNLLEDFGANNNQEYSPQQLTDIEASRDELGVLDLAKLGVKATNSAYWAWQHLQLDQAFDPNWQQNEDLYKSLADQGVPQEYHSQFHGMRSQAAWDGKVKMVQDSILTDQLLQEAGWKGVVAQIVTSFVDPPSFVAAMASGGTANMMLGGARISRMGLMNRTALQGTIAGAEATVAETALINLKPTGRIEDIAFAALGAAAMGSAFGSFSHRSMVREDEGIQAVLQEAQDQFADKTSVNRMQDNGSTTGAVQDTSPVEPISPAAQEAARLARMENLPDTEFGGMLRYDSAGQLKVSEDPRAKSYGHTLGLDAVGHKDGSVVPFTASERQSYIAETKALEFLKTYNDAYSGWAKERGFSRWEVDKDRAIFGAEVTSAMKKQIGDVNPHAQKAASKLEGIYDDYAKLANNPMIDEGRIAKSMNGFEEIVTSHGYVPRVHSEIGVTESLDTFGNNRIGYAIGQAMKAMNSELTDEIATRLGKSYIKTVQKAQVKGGFTPESLSGEDLEGLREMLEEAADPDLLQSDIEWIITELTAKKQGKANVSYGRQRTLMDENFSIDLKTRSTGAYQTFTISDLLENDAEKLFMNYNRTMSGAIALEQAGIVGGVKTIQRDIRGIRSEPHNYKGKNTQERDVANMEYLATTISGKPIGDYGARMIADRQSGFGKTQRVLSDVNFIRLMGQVGFAQIAEIGNLLSSKMFKSMIVSMPDFRAFTRNAAGELDDILSRELEVNLGIGADGIHWGSHLNEDEIGSLSDKVNLNQGLEIGKRMVSVGSGMRGINNILHRTSLRATAQRFADAAFTTARKGFSKKDLSALGLTEESFEEILGQIREHATSRNATGKGGRIYALNLDKWDMDVSATYKLMGRRDSHRLIQQNDVGTTHRYQGTPLGKMIFQFRSFLLSAYTKQTMHGMHKRDFDAFSKLALQTFLGTLVFIGQTHLRAMTKDDPQAYLDRKFKGKDGDEWYRPIVAGFGKTGQASHIPFLVDTGLDLLSYDRLFDNRNSGLSSGGFLSNPALSLGDNILGTAKAALSVAKDDYDWSQVNARDLKGLAPFATILPISMGIDLMMKDLPYKSEGFFD